jgi:hypothetical protein
MARTPEEEVAYALDRGVSRDDLSPAAQAVYDWLSQERQGAEPAARPSEKAEDGDRALTKEERRQQYSAMSRRERQAAIMARVEAERARKQQEKILASVGAAQRKC